MIEAGSVSTQAMSRLRTVAPLQARAVGRHGAGDARRQHVRRADRQAVNVGERRWWPRDQLRRGALPVGQVRLADLLADGDDDALPADHRAEPERDGDRDLDPGRDELGRVVELLLVGAQRRRCRPPRGPVDPASGSGGCASPVRYMSLRTLRDEVGRHLGERAVGLDVVLDATPASAASAGTCRWLRALSVRRSRCDRRRADRQRRRRRAVAASADAPIGRLRRLRRRPAIWPVRRPRGSAHRRSAPCRSGSA